MALILSINEPVAAHDTGSTISPPVFKLCIRFVSEMSYPKRFCELVRGSYMLVFIPAKSVGTKPGAGPKLAIFRGLKSIRLAL